MVQTEHLIIRNASFADVDKFAEWESREDVIEHFCIDGIRDIDAVTDEFHKVIRSRTQKWLSIVLKPDRLIGRIGITDIDEINDSLDLTIIYIADENMRGKGYGKEAVAGALEYAFKEMNMHRVTIDHFATDERGAHLYDTLGFRREGVLVRAGKHNDEYYDLIARAILREEWEEQQEMLDKGKAK